MILLYRAITPSGPVINPAPIVAALGLSGAIDLDRFGPPAGWPTDLPASGYFVVRTTWKGIDVLPGPVTPAQIAALPDPGPDPSIAAATKQAATQTILEVLQTTPIDPVALTANLATCAAAIPDPPAADLTALGTFLALPSPTVDQTAAAAKSLIRALGSYPAVVTAQRATIAVLGDAIRYLLQRG